MRVDAQVLRRPLNNIIAVGEIKARTLFAFSHIRTLILV